MRKNIYQRPDRKRMEIKMAYLLTVLLIPLFLGLFGCEMAPNTPIYIVDAYEDDLSRSEVEDLRLSKPCSTEWNAIETIQLSREEYDVLYDFAYDLITALYCRSYTAADEAALTDAYQFMTSELSAAVSESQYFEKHILNIKENDIYVLMKYLTIANGGYVNVVRDASGSEALMVWATFTLQTRGDGGKNNLFYNEEPWFVPGDTSFELWLYVSKTDDGYRLTEFQESTVSAQRDMLFKPAGVEVVNDVEKIPTEKRDAVLWLIEKHSLNNGEAVTIDDYETVKQIAVEFVSTLYAVDCRTILDTSFDTLYGYMSSELESALKQSSYFERYLTEIKGSSLSISILNQIKSETFERGNAIVYRLGGEEIFLFHCFCDIDVSYEQAPDDEFFFKQGNNKLTVAFLVRRAGSDSEFEIIDWAYSLPLSEGTASE